MDNRIYSIIEQLNKWKGHEDALLQDGTILICRIPDASPLGYLHKIYPPLNTLDIEKIELLLKINLPNSYLDFLLKYNGMELFNSSLSIFGLRKRKEDSRYNQFYQPYDMIIENLGRHEQNEYIKFGSYKDEYELYFKSGEKDKVYMMPKYKNMIVTVFPSFYDCIEYFVMTLSQFFSETGKLVKIKQLFSTDIDSNFIYNMGEII